MITIQQVSLRKGITQSPQRVCYARLTGKPSSDMDSSIAPASSHVHLEYLAQALEEAKKSPPKPTNYCVGAVIVDPSLPEHEQVLATGYSLELPGNTHAEQCCLLKLSQRLSCTEDSLSSNLPRDLVLYTTMEPCSHRLSGNLPCADRIIEAKRIRQVVVGIAEPDTFVKENTGRRKLEEAGINFMYVPELEGEILAVATSGHPKAPETQP